MVNKVGPKGQVVIEKELRTRLGVEPGWLALQNLSGDHVELYFIPPAHWKSLKGSLARLTKVSIPAGDWEKAVRKAWAKEARRKVKTVENES